ncbi:MAG TPA: N-6 DNA methylase [Pyrinomonadaceae bacterium]|nr:N-6 DNA methylase [Pyrinomonadaceae bacterium]
MCTALHDPASGAGGRLREASASLSRILEATAPHSNTAAPAARVWPEPRAVLCQDSITTTAEESKGAFDLVITNPPFGGNVDEDAHERRREDALKTRKTELLFLDTILTSLRPGGRGCVLVPGGVLFGGSKAHLRIRRMLIEENKLLAVIHVPAGAFKPYAGSATSVILFERQTGPTDAVWFDEITSLGYTLDNKRRPTGDDDLPDVLGRWRARRETGGDRKARGFYVPVEELRENDYILQLARYQEVTFEREEYDPPEVIMKEILRLSLEADRSFRELAGMLGMDVDEMTRTLLAEGSAAAGEG